MLWHRVILVRNIENSEIYHIKCFSQPRSKYHTTVSHWGGLLLQVVRFSLLPIFFNHYYGQNLTHSATMEIPITAEIIPRSHVQPLFEMDHLKPIFHGGYCWTLSISLKYEIRSQHSTKQKNKFSQWQCIYFIYSSRFSVFTRAYLIMPFLPRLMDILKGKTVRKNAFIVPYLI